MDVISWVVGLVAGISQPSRIRAIAIGAVVSVAIRTYQYFFADWGDGMPEDLFGAFAMLVVTAAFAWLGSVIRDRRRDRAEVAR